MGSAIGVSRDTARDLLDVLEERVLRLWTELFDVDGRDRMVVRAQYQAAYASYKRQLDLLHPLSVHKDYRTCPHCRKEYRQNRL